MKFKKNVLVAMLVGITLVTLSGCGNASKEDTQDSNTQGETTLEDQVLGVSLENPILVDKDAKTVTVLSQVNGKYFTQTTRHASVFKDGSNGAKSIFTAYATHQDFHQALLDIGAEPGNNMTMENAATTHVEGSSLNMKVTWNGADKEYDANEVIVDGNNNPIAFKFGGNLEMAESKNTGCLACLDSCPVGIVSNSTYTLGAVEDTKEVTFMGNSEILPEDGTYVATIYTVAN